ncbi:MAG: YgiQ family radical SAM protein, partial [Bacteroidota bacterium]
MFLPTTKQELIALGWDCPDVVLVSGDVYIDSPYDGVAIIGKVLLDAGYRVGIISQPDVNSADDIMRLGEPKLFWGISSGVCDSMVANYTALMKRKRNDDLTPGGVNDKRPDRAVIAYTNLIKKYYKNAKPIVLGGVEASLRRVAHYDYWDNKIRRSVLFDSKADAIVYGMGEKTILELAEHFKKGTDFLSTRGICYVAKEAPEKFKELPPFESVRDDKV